MDSKETKKWYYVLPVVSIGIFILAWVWLSSAENSMIPTPLATWEKFLNIMTNPISQAILPVHRIAAAAENLDKIIVSGGRIGSQLELKPEDLRKACKGEFADITV